MITIDIILRKLGQIALLIVMFRKQNKVNFFGGTRVVIFARHENIVLPLEVVSRVATNNDILLSFSHFNIII